MPIPGPNLTFGDATTSAGAPLDTAQWFVCGETEKGLPDTAYKVTSLPTFDSQLGGRLATSVLRDAVETALREGVSVVYVSRILGAAHATASITLNDGAGTPAPSVKVSAASPGAWGNDLKVAVIAGTGLNVKLRVSDASGILETSPEAATVADLVAWKATNVVVTALGANLPATASDAPLTGGNDDLAGVTAAEKTAALDAFPPRLGPGQLAYPGETDATVLTAAAAHCIANDRVLLQDVPDTDTIADMTAIGAEARADANAEVVGVFGPWVTIPGIVPGTTRRVPYSAVEAGVIARADRLFGPGRAGAGDKFPLQYAVDFADFTDAEHETALLAGVNLAKDVYGIPQTYGFRSAADPTTDPDWIQFNYARLRMALSVRLKARASSFVFETIDPHGHTLQAFKAALTAVIGGFGDAVWNFVVDVDSVNNETTAKAGELHAQIAVQFSPHAEAIYINVAKLPLGQTL